MSRFRAAGIHLIISGLIVITLLFLMFGIWYPNKYFQLMGGTGLIYLIVGIDLCLGPLLTLAVFKSGKKGLLFDLTLIGLVQIAALAYGSFIMFNARPVFVAFGDGAFSVATASEVSDAELSLATNPAWSKRSLSGPILVGIKKPKDEAEVKELEFFALGMGYARFPKLFVPYESQKNEILKAAKPISLLIKSKPDKISEIKSFLNDQNRPEDDFVFLPINSFFGDMSVILDAKTAQFISIIDVSPYPTQQKK